MAVLTGRNGQFYVDGARVARCAGWELEESRPMLESTTVDSWDRTFLPGRIEGTGNAQLLYDPNDAAAVAFFESIFTAPTSTEEIAVEAVLDDATGVSYPMAVLVSSVSHAVSKGEAQMRSVAFRLSDVGLELEIVGSSRAGLAATQRYTGNVFGLSGAWTYLWTIAGPTISDPTSQTTNITFDTLGSYTLTLTATLGATVLTETLNIEVIDVPLLMVSRVTSLAEAGTGAAADGTCCIDPAAQVVYHIAVNHPDASVSTSNTILSRLAYDGTRQATRRINGVGTGGSESPLYMQVLTGGDLFVVTRSNAGAARWFRLSPDLSTVVWQVRGTNTDMNGFAYDPISDRVFFQYTYIASPPTVGYIDLSSGAATRVSVGMTPSFTPRQSSPIVLQSGNVLFAFADGETNRISFMECTNDLRVGGVFGPVETVEHTFSFGLGETAALLETDDYIASVGFEDGDISIYSKTDYSHVRTVSYSAAGKPLTFYYANGQIVVSYQDGSNGWRIFRVNEGLTTQLSNDRIFSSTSGLTAPVSLVTMVAGSANAYDEGLGLMATHALQRGLSPNLAEMLVLFRANYGASGALDYGPYDMNITPSTTPLTETVHTPTSSINRTYTLTPASVSTGATSVTTTNETALTFDSYVLTA
jgi:PKD repeat protein